MHFIPEKGQEARADQYFGHNIAYSHVIITNFMAVLILTWWIFGVAVSVIHTLDG